MDGEQKFWLILWIAVVVVAGALGMEATYLCHKLDKAYIEAGYTRQPLPGEEGARWVLPDKD